MEKIKIQILLSTYNGEKYLEEQLESILKLQGDFDIKVLIRDDFSADSTISILEIYEKNFGFNVIYGEENLGLNKSMHELFKACDLNCDYFAFCNQDDIWKEDKFIKGIEQLSKFSKDDFVLFTSTSLIVDEKLNPKGLSLIPDKISFYNAMVENISLGHTQIFGRNVAIKLAQNYSTYIHEIDWWIYLHASCFGKIIFENSYTVLHRQHGKNAVGYETSFIRKTIRRLKYIKKGKGNTISLQLKAFYDFYQTAMPEQYKKELENYINCQNSLAKRISYAISCKAFRQKKIENIIFKLLYISGKYRI